MEIGILILVVLTSAVLLKGRANSNDARAEVLGVIAVDLPCPWCDSATTEADNVCPTCGQTFGE